VAFESIGPDQSIARLRISGQFSTRNGVRSTLIDVHSCGDEGPGGFLGVQLGGCEVHLAARLGGSHSGSRLYGAIESILQA
jgi:hypothetical protein